MTSSNSADGRKAVRGGALYRLIWKWHFLAGLLVLPFMAFMAVTGLVNLYHKELHETLYSSVLNVVPAEEALPYEQLAVAATAAVPGRITNVFFSEKPGRSVSLELASDNGAVHVIWVNPYSAEVLGTARKATMPLEFIERAHASFTAGLAGRLANEALTCWAIVMFVTGLYLWWPRGARGWANVLEMPKGEGRPWTPEDERAELLLGFACVDLVVLFDEPTLEATLRALVPDVHAKGPDYTPGTVPERHVDRELGVEIAICGDPKDHSTTEMVERVRGE